MPLIVDNFGISSGIGGTNVEDFDVTLDQLPEYPNYLGRVGSTVLADSLDTDRSNMLTFRINKTNDGQLPRNIIIYIEGCNQTLVPTKAQIEQRGTTPAGKFIYQKGKELFQK